GIRDRNVTGVQTCALPILENALAVLPGSGTKQRSVLLLDLATARAGTDPDHAVELASQAVNILQTIWYPTARDRLPALRTSLGRSEERRVGKEDRPGGARR